jgi:hypothetical protein
VETASAQFVQAWPKQRRDVSAQDRAWLGEHMARVPVSVAPMIRTTLPTSSVLALQVGEVLTLPLQADRPIDIYVGGMRKLSGRLAADRGRLMVTVKKNALRGRCRAHGECVMANFPNIDSVAKAMVDELALACGARLGGEGDVRADRRADLRTAGR